MEIDGACHCGEITFTAEIDPSRVMICNCTDCQIQSGGAFRMVVLAPVESFQLQGQPRRYVKVSESGNRRAQMFCPTCATPLFACAPEHPTSVSIRLGCVKQRGELVPPRRYGSVPPCPGLRSCKPSPAVPSRKHCFRPRAAPACSPGDRSWIPKFCERFRHP